MDEVTEPFGGHGGGVSFIGGHEIGPLAQKGLRIGWHFIQIEKDDKHFDNCSLWIEQSQLYRTPPRYVVSEQCQSIK